MKLAREDDMLALADFVIRTKWLENPDNTKVREQMSHVSFFQDALSLPKCSCEGKGHYYSKEFINNIQAPQTQKMLGAAASFRHRELVLRHGKKVVKSLDDGMAVMAICAELVSHCIESDESASVDPCSEAAVCKTLLWYAQHTTKGFLVYQAANMVLAMQNDCRRPQSYNLTLPTLWFWSEVITGSPIGTDNYHQILNPEEAVSC